MLFEKSTLSPRSENKTANESVYAFVKDGQRWYIDLPEYLAGGGSKADLQMKDGADVLLDFMAHGKKVVTLQLDREPFHGADVLELVELCEAPKGGGYYVMHSNRNSKIEKRIWLCDVTLFVFGDMPQRIYIRKLSSRPAKAN